MRITYVGPHRPGVDVPELGMAAVYNTPIEVPDELAHRLLRQQTNWAEAKPEKPAKTKSSEEGD